MWKTRTKLSKLLTNIHAGFATALLGCVLTFAPLSAMAKPTFTNGNAGSCTVVTSAASPMHLNPVSCTNGETLYFRTSSNVYYSYSECPCASDEAPNKQTFSARMCGTGVTITYTAACGSCTATTDTTSCASQPLDSRAENCRTGATTYCIGGQRVQTCNKVGLNSRCATGWSEVSGSVYISGCGTTFTYYTCSKCTTDDACGGTVDNERTAYIHTTTNTCNAGTCKKSYSCKCNTGYYGSNLTASSNYCSGCTACPTDSKSGEPGKSAVGSDAIGDCYISSGASYTTDIGTITYSGNCYY